jgi:cell division protein YceG involved in septum cleavage
MVKDKKNFIIISLVVIIMILLLVLGYFFLIKPSINNLVIKGYNQGAQDAVITIAQQAATCANTGVPLTVGNVTLNLVALQCYQQQATQTGNSGNYSSVQ